MSSVECTLKYLECKMKINNNEYIRIMSWYGYVNWVVALIYNMRKFLSLLLVLGQVILFFTFRENSNCIRWIFPSHHLLVIMYTCK